MGNPFRSAGSRVVEASTLSHSLTMGRNLTYLTSSAKKRAKQATQRYSAYKRVYIGKAIDAWVDAKRATGAKSDAALAKILLDRCQVRFLVHHVSDPVRFIQFFFRIIIHILNEGVAMCRCL